ncbi:hypothetical protein R5W23_003220 [Gemmata sp. JC673]|uniref:Transposase n=1 Tax=Gemmata algarum TaxID=2975278 RepID=A0ABU5F4Q5_9BACT|nr:hypothetical protein [Gemmata algarum]MDY3561792.1 hypothetical protein [Gemmata algarum]
MRSDMGKVLVERPRIGRSRAERWPGKGYKKRVGKCLDAGESPPVREGIKRSYGGQLKHFNEHLGPLRRFISANVGRPWDKVYSEICRHVDRGNVVQKHILTHLFQYVVTNTVLIDGEPCRGEAYARRYGEPLRTSDRRDQWYVCPKSGLLRASRYVRRPSPRGEPDHTLKLNNRQLCVCRAGKWELITVVMTGRCTPQEPPLYDAVIQQHLQKHVGSAEVVCFYRNNRYAVSQRPLSRRELLALPIPIDCLR